MPPLNLVKALQKGDYRKYKYTTAAATGFIMKNATSEAWLIIDGYCSHVTGTDLEFIIYDGTANDSPIMTHKPCLAADGNETYPFYNTRAAATTGVKPIFVPPGGTVEVWGDTGGIGYLMVLEWMP